METFDDLLAANADYGQHFAHPGLPGKAARGLAVITCMDSRLAPLELLGLRPGDAKILRNAGGRVTDDVLRTLVLAVHVLDVRRVLVLPHTDCRMTKVTDEQVHAELLTRGTDTRSLQFGTISDQRAQLAGDVQRIRSWPYLPADLAVLGGIYDVATGLIEVAVPPRIPDDTRELRGSVMHILVLGGTSFVGRAIVEDAVGAGHHVTLFSRGRTGPDLFPDLERRTGDRESGDYASLTHGKWDAVIDVSGYVPRHVNQAADALGDRGGRYLFISTGSVYDRGGNVQAVTEDHPRQAPEKGTEEITADTYGPLKVACEDDVVSRFEDQATIVRPGIVAGPHDPTDRFTYWVRRAARGGKVAVPGRLEQPVQVVDSRDLARLVVALLEQDRGGVFNAVGPAEPVTLEQLVHACAAAAGTNVEVVAVPTSSVEPGFPLVLRDPAGDAGFRRSAAAAYGAGMPKTPLITTARDVLVWDTGRGTPPLAVELSAEREAELLSAS